MRLLAPYASKNQPDGPALVLHLGTGHWVMVSEPIGIIRVPGSVGNRVSIQDILVGVPKGCPVSLFFREMSCSKRLVPVTYFFYSRKSISITVSRSRKRPEVLEKSEREVIPG